jgi:hypothetical protein
MRRLSVLLSLFAFLAATPAMYAKDGNNGNGKSKAKQEWKRKTDNEWRRDTDRNRTVRNRDWDRDDDLGGWARRTEGHRPHDMNGDGRITRNEWPGNDVSFRRLDRNGDGVISEYDRSLRPNTSNIHGSRARGR